MAKYVVDFVENKNPDWKIAQLVAEDNAKFADVSVNRTNKKGEVFPNFDLITPAATVEGELWQSQAGKWYLFAPKPQSAPSGQNRGSGVAKMMEKKEKSIEKFQTQKEESIILTSSARDATLFITTFYKADEVDELFLKEKWQEWRKWLLDQYKTDVSDPF